MASITIRKLDDEVKARLHLRAALHRRSMEEEARIILRTELMRENADGTGPSWVQSIRDRIEPLGGVELELPSRTGSGDHRVPDFSDPAFDLQ